MYSISLLTGVDSTEVDKSKGKKKIELVILLSLSKTASPSFMSLEKQTIHREAIIASKYLRKMNVGS